MRFQSRAMVYQIGIKLMR